MSDSVLTDTKKILGLASDYTVFDLDIVTHINATFSTLNQLGVGPLEGYFISDETDTWDGLNLPDNQLSMVKSYLYLSVRFLFDPPSTSFLIEAQQNQIRQFEWRLNAFRETSESDSEEFDGYDILDGGNA